MKLIPAFEDLRRLNLNSLGLTVNFTEVLARMFYSSAVRKREKTGVRNEKT